MCIGLEVQFQPNYGEKVAQTHALEALFFQASQPVYGVALVVHLDQVKGPDVQKCLKACHPMVDNDLLLLVIPIVLPAVMGCLVMNLWVEELEHPQIFVTLAQLAPHLLEWPQGYVFKSPVCVEVAAA
jgi:hypothetical protein